MAIEIRLPNITGVSEKEQLLQLKSYLYQLSEQLQWAFDNINTTGGTGNGYVVNQAPRAFTASSGGASSSGGGINFAELKALIIKSADIVDAYYEEINKKLVGLYVAQSDFGVYAQQTEAKITANSKSITQNYTNTQTLITDTNERIDVTNGNVDSLNEGLGDATGRIGVLDDSLTKAKEEINENIQDVSESISTVDGLRIAAEEALNGRLEDLNTDLGDLKNAVINVTAYIKSGELYTTAAGVPVYGIEIGQQVGDVFNKFSRFTSEKLSFYDANNNEVAYISDKKLYIGQAEITISLKVGGFVDYVMDGDVVTKWEGGS